MKWENVYIFISSTFNDMHAERDYLVKRVFPELRLWCNKRMLKLVDVDLRWGVSEKDATENKRVLDVCLNNIDRCRPFFLCLLGQRRGWIPQLTDINEHTLQQFPGIRPYLGRHSITELEVIHALLEPFDGMQPCARHAFFYFRNEDYLEMMADGPVKNVFRNQEEMARDQEQFCQFKELIRGRYPITPYDATWNKDKRSPELRNVQGQDLSVGRLEQFQIGQASLAEHVLEQLKEAIRKEFPEHFIKTEKGDLLETERSQQDTFLFNACDSYILRAEEEQVIYDYVAGDSQRPLAIVANAGAGKTSLLAHVIQEWQQDVPVFYRFVGTSAGSSEVMTTLYLLLLEISRAGLIEEKLVEESKHDILLVFPNLLEKLEGHNCCIILDAIDQWNHASGNSMKWLPELLPEGVKLVLSVKSGSNTEIMEALERKHVAFYEMDGLCQRSEKTMLIQTYLSQFLKDIDEVQIERILSLHGSNNPLYLKVVLNELRIHGSFDTLMEQLSKDYGQTPVEAFDMVLERLESDEFSDRIGPKDLSAYVLGLVANSLEGVRYEEFVDVFRNRVNDTDRYHALKEQEIYDAVYGLCRHLSPYLVLDDGRVNFLYDSFRQAAKLRYKNLRGQFQHILAEMYDRYCRLQEISDVSCLEDVEESDMICLFHHAMECSVDWTRAIITNPWYVFGLLQKTSAIRLAGYFKQVAERYELLADCKDMAYVCRKLASRLDMGPNTIFMELSDRLLQTKCPTMTALCENSAQMDLPYYYVLTSNSKHIYEADRELKIYEMNGIGNRVSTLVAGNYLVVYSDSNNYIVLQNLETGEVERQVRLRYNIDKVFASERRLDVVYRMPENEEREMESIDDLFEPLKKLPALESFSIPSMESVLYREEWPELPEGFSWKESPYAYDGVFYLTAHQSADEWLEENAVDTPEKIVCRVSQESVIMDVETSGMEMAEVSLLQYRDYGLEMSITDRYRRLWHIPSRKMLNENLKKWDGFWACAEGNRLWVFDARKDETGKSLMIGYIYEGHESDVELVYEHTFSKEESDNLTDAKDVVVCQGKVFFLGTDGILNCFDEKFAYMGSVKVDAHLDFLDDFFSDGGWNSMLLSQGKYLLRQDHNRMLIFDTEKMISALRPKWIDAPWDREYQTLAYEDKLYLIDTDIRCIDTKTSAEQIIYQKTRYIYDLQHVYAYPDENGKMHNCILGYGQQKSRITVFSLDDESVLADMEVHFMKDAVYNKAVFWTGQYLGLVLGEQLEEKNPDGSEKDRFDKSYLEAEYVYYYEPNNARPVKVWKLNNATQSQMRNVMEKDGVVYYISRGNFANGLHGQLAVCDLTNGKVLGITHTVSANDSLPFASGGYVLGEKICIDVKREQNQKSDGKYRYEFDLNTNTWETAALPKASMLGQINQMLFWKEKGAKEIRITSAETFQQIGVLNCITGDECKALFQKEDEYVVIHEKGICEVFSAVDYRRKFTQMLGTGYTDWIDCYGSDKICLTARYLRYCVYDRETTKDMVVRQNRLHKMLLELDALFDD